MEAQEPSCQASIRWGPRNSPAWSQSPWETRNSPVWPPVQCSPGHLAQVPVQPVDLHQSLQEVLYHQDAHLNFPLQEVGRSQAANLHLPLQEVGRHKSQLAGQPVRPWPAPSAPCSRGGRTPWPSFCHGGHHLQQPLVHRSQHGRGCPRRELV